MAGKEQYAMNYNNTLKVCVNGKPVRTHEHDGRVHIEGREESQYTLKVKNPYRDRVLAVVTVDGLNTITGEPGDENGQGWVIEGYETLEIKGFQKDDDSAGAFKFVGKEDSYAEEVGTSETSGGVIGVTFFKEDRSAQTLRQLQDLQERIANQPPIYVPTFPPSRPEPEPIPWTTRPIWWGTTTPTTMGEPEPYATVTTNTALYHAVASGETASRRVNMDKVTASNNSSPDVADFDLGTGWGEEVSQPVTSVDFERGDIAHRTAIYYASRAALKGMGVKFEKPRKKVSKLPDPFPENTYAKPPSGWKG